MDNELWTISRILQWTEQYFRSKGIESSRLDGEVLLSHSLGFDRPLDKAELDAYRPLVVQRAKGYSVAAITGHKEFMGLDFHVNEHVLIPRPDTETLIEDILSLYDVDAAPRVLDLCTGPGTILLSLLHYLPNATGVGVDISNKALGVAEENRISLELADVSRFCESDIKQLLEQVKVGKGTEYGAVLDACKSLLGEELISLEGVFDVLVSNPPYITTAEMNTLSQEVLHEPHIALHGGTTGLEFYVPIIREGWRFVKDGGYLVIEIGQGQEDAVSKLAVETGCYGEPVYQHDIAGIIREVRWKIQRK